MSFQKIREWLVLGLIILLPFHAFLVTVGTRFFAGAGQAPLPWLAGWKEVLLIGVLIIVILEACFSLLVTRYSLRTDVIDGLILGMLVLGIVVSIIHYPAFALRASAGRQLSIINFVYGFKYTLFPLFLFLFLRRVSWSDCFCRLSSFIFLLVGTAVSFYGILTLFLPQTFFTFLGYSDLHSTYLPDGPLAAFQYLEGSGIRRMQSTFAGPNQLGAWLLIPWSVALSGFLRFPSPLGGGLGRGGRELPIFTLALFLTFSRAAWIGAAVILLVALRSHFSRRTRCWLLVAGFSFLAALFVISAIMRPQSTVEHIRRPLQALRVIAQHPLGLGLGAAGPAANRTGDPCMYFKEGTDVSWAADRPSLCVFVGDQQVQPAGRVCHCPLLPENWYLQVGVELGVLGLVLYLALVGVIGYRLSVIGYHSSIPPFLNSSILFVFVGIAVAAIFLHAWEDSAVAYTVWILVATALPPLNPRRASLPTLGLQG